MPPLVNALDLIAIAGVLGPTAAPGGRRPTGAGGRWPTGRRRGADEACAGGRGRTLWRRTLALFCLLGLVLPALALSTPPPAKANLATQAAAPAQTAQASSGSAAGNFAVSPDAGGVPGVPKLHTLVNALYAIVLVLVVAGFLASAGAWALGAHSNHYQAASYGKRGLLVSSAAAAALGVGPAFLSFLFGLFGGGAGG